MIGDSTESVIIDNITLKGNKLFGDKLIKSKLGIDIGDTVDRDVVREAMRRVYGINGFKQTAYELENNGNNHVNMDVLMKERLPTMLSASMHIDNVFSAGLLLNLTSRDLIGKESRLVLLADISSDPKFRVDYYKYAGGRKNFAFNLRYNYLNTELPTYEEGEAVDVTTNKIQNFELNALTTQSLKQSFKVGVFYSYETQSSNYKSIISPEIGKGKRKTYGLEGSYTRNTLNDRNFPTSGAEITITSRLYFNTDIYVKYSDESTDSIHFSNLYLPKSIVDEFFDDLEPDGVYSDLNIYGRKYFHLSDRDQIIPMFNLGLTLGTVDNPENDFSEDKLYNRFAVGGHQRVYQTDTRAYGYNYYELNPTNFGLAGVEYQHVFFGNFFMRAGANVISTYEFVPLNDLDEFSFSDLYENGTHLGYGLQGTFRTRIGPFSAGVSRNTADGYLRYYFSYGFSFNYSD